MQSLFLELYSTDVGEHKQLHCLSPYSVSGANAAGTPKDYIEVVNLQPSIGVIGTNGANKLVTFK